LLKNYRDSPKADFWEDFLKNTELNVSPPSINVNSLEQKVIAKQGILGAAQFLRGMRAVNILKFGAPAYQRKSLGSCFVRNAENTYRNGPLITDSVATWVKKDFVKGPFKEPPIEKFRVNCLMAIEQHDKIRLVLNVSLPEENSFNSNIIDEKLEKVNMSSARLFGYEIVKSGKNSWMSKFDLCNAYKNIPCKKEDFRLQGFKWLDKFFFESKQIFGARTSVANFDIVGNTLKALALCDSEIPSNFVHRQLDDVPIVGPAHKTWCKDFSEKYENLCKDLNVEIAKNCPKNEKAFCNQKEGKVLGIIFNTEQLSWSLPLDKKIKTLTAIKFCLDSEKLELLDMQKLLGRLNDVALMCPFLNVFKRPLLDDLCKVQDGSVKNIILSSQSRKDLMIWAGMLLDVNSWLPIPSEPCGPPISCKMFVSDAAGLAADSPCDSGPGVASVGFDQNGEIIFAKRIVWPKEMIEMAKDSKGVRFGDKSTTLEMFGLLLPILLIPNVIKNQHIVMKVDNIACIHGWENHSCRNDISASIILRGMQMICAYLNVNVHVRHLPRKSSYESNMVDRMSRTKTCSVNDVMLLKSFDNIKIPVFLSDWICNPVEDWAVAHRMLLFVKMNCYMK